MMRVAITRAAKGYHGKSYHDMIWVTIFGVTMITATNDKGYPKGC